MSNPETSIVIRAFNEQRYLPGLLRAIDNQTYRDFETLVVDSGSHDGTPDIAIKHGARLIRIHSRDFTFGFSLNVGIGSSLGRYIVIVSAHTEPIDTSWLASLVQPFNNDEVAMVYGRQLGAKSSKFSETQDLKRTFGDTSLTLRPPHFFANNANSVIRKDLWEHYQFDETLPGLEDIDWAKYWMERDYQVVYEPRAALYHIHNETWRQVRWRYYREALAAKWIGTKTRADVPLELVRDGKYLIEDLVQAGREGLIHKKSVEVLAFRGNKVIGTIRGLWSGTNLADPKKRDALFFDRSFKAVVINGPHRAALQEIQKPTLKPGDVFIKVAYAGVCATDLEILDGTLGYYKTGVTKYPIIPGHELSGKVAQVGSNIKHLKEGDQVVIECIQSCGECQECKDSNWIGCSQRAEIGVMGKDGGYAEYIVVPGRFAHKFNEGTSLKEACLCEPVAVVLKGLKRLEHVLGEEYKGTCGVVGAGPIGHICAQILALKGHHVTAFDLNHLRRSNITGVHPSITTSGNLEGLSQCKVIIEATGSLTALTTVLNNTIAGTTILLLGLPYAKHTFNFEEIVVNDKAVIGAVGSSADDFQEALVTLPQLNLLPLTSHVFPLERFGEAWEASRNKKLLKAILEIDGSMVVPIQRQ